MGAMVAVAEVGSGRGKTHSTSLALPQASAFFPLKTLLALICIGFAAINTVAHANPTGGVAVVGQMATTTQGNHLQVSTQNGAGLNHSAINWQTFSVGAGQSTHFQQPNASSTVINRVVTHTPTQIFGNLSSNGHLVLVNQAGIAVGAGAVVDTAGFIASTLPMSDADTLLGRLRFGGSGGAVQVSGHVLARSGDAVLIGQQVQTGEQALIQAPNGSTVLAAGQQVEITGRGLEGIHMTVQAPSDQAVNLGKLQGDAVAIFAGTLKHSGAIQATRATLEGGKVVLKAAADAVVDGQGSITASGTRGGSVDVLGQRVGLADQARIDARGTQGGGSVRIGGDYQGKNAEVPNAQITYVGQNTHIDASATEQGDGGRVIVWADDITRTHGRIDAVGGAQGGDGGFVETSGKRVLDASATVDASAPKGKAGTWLLDPDNINIDVSISSNVTGGPNFSNTAGTATLNVGSLTSALGSTNVTVTSSGSISVLTPVAWSSANMLTLSGNADIAVNQGITASSGALVLTNSGAGAITNNSGSALIEVDKLAVHGSSVSITGMNKVNTFAGRAASAGLVFENSAAGGLQIGSVAGIDGIQSYFGASVRQYSAGGISVNNNVTTLMGGTVTLGVASGGGSIHLGGGASSVTIGSSGGTQIYTSGGGISQTQAVMLNGNLLMHTNGTGAIVLNNTSNDFAGVQLDGAYKALSLNIADTNALSLAGTPTSGAITVSSAGTLSVIGAIDSNSNSISLSGSSIAFTAAGSVNSGSANATLSATGTGASTTVAAGATISGATVTVNTDNLLLSGGISAGNAVAITRYTDSAGSPVEIQVGSGAVDGSTTLGISQTEIDNINTPIYRIGDTTRTGGLLIAGSLNIPAGKTLSLMTSTLGGSQIAQSAGATITADHVFAQGGNGVTLTNATNFISNFSARTTGGDVRLKQGSTPLQIGTVDGVAGIDVGGNNVWLDVGLTLSNSQPVTAAGLKLVSGSAASISLTGMMVNTLAADFNNRGAFSFQNGKSLTIGTVDSLNGIGYSGNTNPLSVSTSVGDLTVSQAIVSDVLGGASITLTAANTLNVNANITSTFNATPSGPITLSSGTGGISGSGVLFANGLRVASGGAVNLTGNNKINILAGTAAGSGLFFNNSIDLNVGSVAGQNGISASAGDVKITLPGTANKLTISNGVLATTGNVVYEVNQIDIGNTTFANGFVEIKASQVPTAIEFSASADAAGTLRLSASELSNISAPMLKVGNSGNTGNITFKESVSLGLGGVTLSLITGGQIQQDAGKTVTVANLNAHGAAGVTLTEVNSVSGNLAGQVTSGNFSFTNSGGITVDQVDVVNNGIVAGGNSVTLVSQLGSVTQAGTASITAENLTVSADGSIHLPHSSNALENVVTLSSTSGSINLKGSSTYMMNLSASTTGSSPILLDVNADHAVVAANVVSEDGDISIINSNNVKITNISTSGAISTTASNGEIYNYSANVVSGGTVNLVAKTGIGSSDAIPVSASAGGLINAQVTDSGGTIKLISPTGNMRVGSVSALGGTVHLEATAAAVSDANGATNNVATNSFTVNAATGIGLGDALDVNIANLCFSNGSGNVFIENSSTALALGTFSISSGNWYIYHSSPATLNKNGITSNFRHYGVSYSTYPSPSEPGNGFLYASAAPALTVNTTLASGSGSHIWRDTPNAVFGYTLTGFTDAEDNATNIGLGGTASYSFAPSSSTNAGSHPVAYSSGLTSSSGYSFSPGTSYTYTVNKRNLTLTAVSDTRVYNATKLSSGTPIASGLAGGDTVSGLSQEFTSKNVLGTNGSTLTPRPPVSVNDGNSGNNYAITYVTASGTITPKAISATGLVAQNKVYDGTASATLSGVVSGVEAVDVVSTGTLVGVFSDKNVGVSKSVTVSGFALTGADAGNYTLGSSVTVAADITPKSVVATYTAKSKTYDGSTSASVVGTSSEFVASDLVSVTQASAVFSDKNAGVGKTVQINGVALSGADAGNYSLINTSTTVTADIQKKSVNTVYSAANKVYDGSTTASVTLTSKDLVPNDSVTISQKAAFADKNAGTGKTVSITGIALGGADAGNYSLASTSASTTADISRADTVAWVGGASGNWSNATNWAGGALPDAANVAEVVIPAGSSVNYDMTSATSVERIASSGALSVSGTGVLTVGDYLKTAQYSQSAGTVQGTGAAFAEVSTGFSKSGGNLSMPARIALHQSVGDLVVSGGVQAPKMSLQAPNGQVNVNVSNIGATTSIELLSVVAGAGSVSITNTGGVVTTGEIKSVGGDVWVQAHSPITIGTAGVSATGSISLLAQTADSSSNVTLNGPLKAVGGGVTIAAHNNVVQNSAISASTNVAVSTGVGTVTLGATATTDAPVVNYSAAGGAVAAPVSTNTSSTSNTARSTQAGNIVNTFLEKFEAAVQEEEQDAAQAVASNDGKDEKKKKKQEGEETRITEGEVCLP